MNFAQVLLIIWLLLPAPISVYLAYVVYQRSKGANVGLLAFMLLAGVWSSGHGLELLFDDRYLIELAVSFQYIGIAFLPVSWFLICLGIRWRALSVLQWPGFLLMIVPTVTFVLQITSAYHSIFYASRELTTASGFTVLDKVYGSYFWFHVYYSYSLMLAGLILISMSLIESRLLYARQRALLIVMLALPWSGNVLYITQFQNAAVDFSALTIMLGVIAMYLSVHRYRLGELSPVTRATVMSKMEAGMIVFNEDLRILDLNRSAVALLKPNTAEVGLSADAVFSAHPRLRRLLERTTDKRTELVYTGFQQKIYRINVESIIDDNQLMVFRDVSSESRVLDAIQVVLSGTGQDTGEEFYKSLAQSLAASLKMRIGLVGRLHPQDQSKIMTLAVWDNDRFLESFQYDLEGAPCENVINGSSCVYRKNVASLFPRDAMLADMGIEAYIGTPLTNHAGETVGLLVVMDDKPINEEEIGVSLVEIFAMRAAAELERGEYESKVTEGEARLQGMEQQVQQAQKMESLGVLAGGVAHDFNNLLTPILGYVDLAKFRHNDPKTDEYLDKMRIAAEKLAELCQQMLTYSGKGQVEISLIDLDQQIQAFHDLVRASVPRTTRLIIEAGEAPKVRADATQVNQILLNLVINASEAIHGSNGEIRVTTGTERLSSQDLTVSFPGDQLSDDYVFVEVSDNGPGIEPENLEKMFEPFFTTKFEGRGLGMAVVYGILRAHDGAIRIVSDLGEGTSIRVYFPIEKGIEQMEIEQAESVQEPAHVPSTGKVLVVDDEDYVRGVLRGMLANMGLEAVEASDGSSGLEAFSDEIMACVIDLTMPGMAGMELLAKIREKDANVPVLLVSGYSRHEVRQQEARANNVSFLQKPFTLDQFRRAMETQLSKVVSV